MTQLKIIEMGIIRTKREIGEPLMRVTSAGKSRMSNEELITAFIPDPINWNSSQIKHLLFHCGQ